MQEKKTVMTARLTLIVTGIKVYASHINKITRHGNNDFISVNSRTVIQFVINQHKTCKAVWL